MPVLRQDLGERLTMLQQRLRAAGQPQARQVETLREQLQEFSSLLLLQMLQAMRRTVPQSGLMGGGYAHDMYLSLFDQEVARQMAHRTDLGLNSLWQRQLEVLAPSQAGQGEAPPAASGARQQAIAAYQQQATPAQEGFGAPLAGRVSSAYDWRQQPHAGPEK